MREPTTGDAEHDLVVLGEVLPDGIEPAGGAAAAPGGRQAVAGRLELVDLPGRS